MLEWQVDALGGTLTTPELSDQIRIKAQSKQRFRDLSTVEEKFGLNRGDTLQFKKAGNAAEGRIIAEDETVPTTNLTFTSSTAICREYSLAIDYTWRVENLAKLSVYDQVIIGLTNSMSRTLDRAAGTVFLAMDLVYTPTGTASDPQYTLGTAGLALAQATRPWSVWDHGTVMDLMANYNMPFYDDVGFVCVGSTKFLRGFKRDGTWERLVAPQNAGRAFRGEVGEYDGCRFIHETNVLDDSIGLNSVLGEAVYIAADAVMEVVVLPEEIQAKLGQDYGRDQGMRWVYYGVWVQTWDYPTEGDARGIAVKSL